MKALIVGAKGQLGAALQESAPAAADIVAKDLPGFDILDASAVSEFCRSRRPDVIFNAAAYTAVDKAETEPEAARAINVEGVRNISVAAAEASSRLIHVSTDFVFDGLKPTPYEPRDMTAPLSVYGRTKRDGERVVAELLPNSGVIVRTAWLYSATGDNFVKTMLRLFRERDEIRVVADQVGTPTWARSLATALWRLAEIPELSGIYHWTDKGQATWYEFARAIQDSAFSLGLLQRKIPIHAIATTDYPTPARRPKFSLLDCSTTQTILGYEPNDWRVNLDQMLRGMKS